jgi:hypothetical protein
MRFSPALPLLSSARYWAKVADSFPNIPDPGVAGSNPACSTIQSVSFRTFRRIARNPRVCARFAIMRGPGEHPRRPEIGRIQQNLSGRDLARSMDHRRKFACSWNSANRTARK